MKKRPGVYQIPLEGRELVDIPDMIQLLPAGPVHSLKGDFLVDAESVRAIMADANLRQNDLVVDYEHQTLTGQEAPAAAWIKALEDRGPDGIWGKVEWTPRAREYVANREYRYLSPVILVRKSDKRVIAIRSAGLTNTPAIDGMVPIVNKWGEAPEEDEQTVEFLQKLRNLLGLGDDAGEDVILQHVQNMMGMHGQVANKEVLGLLDLDEKASLDAVKGKILALKNPSGYVRVEEFKALKDQLAKRDRDDLVSLALNQGKIAPAQKAWAEEYALKDPAGFKAFIDQAPGVVPLGEVAGGGKPGDTAVIDDVQMMVNKQLGISDEMFKTYGGDK